MRRLCALALIVALGAAMFIPVVFAQQPVIPQWVTDSNQRKTVQPGANSFPVQEQFPPELNVQFYPMVISAIFSPCPDAANGGGMTNRDSTVVFDTRGYNRAALMVFASPTATQDIDGGSADSLGAALFALQVRHHVMALSDTNNTLLPPRMTGSGGFTNDSIGTFTEMAYYAGTRPRVINTLLPNERPLPITNVGQVYNRGIWIPIDRLDRPGASAPQPSLGSYMSFRFRMIKSYMANTMTDFYALAGAKDTLCTNSPASLVRPPRVRLRVDLYLWRE